MRPVRTSSTTLAWSVCTDVGEVDRATSLRQLGHGRVGRPDARGAAPVCEHAMAIGALQLQQVAEQGERRGERLVVRCSHLSILRALRLP